LKDSNLNGDGTELSLNKLDKERPNNALGYAKVYAAMGLPVVPNEGKRPLLKGWTDERLSEEDLPRYFGNGQNVGLVNGEPSGGLVTVDMDVPEAPKIADRFLPKTVRSGRESTPDAHAWYRAPGMRTKKWQDTDDTVLLEARSDGCQTLAPSSKSISGERYGWLLMALESQPRWVRRSSRGAARSSPPQRSWHGTCRPSAAATSTPRLPSGS
jgi:Bifunctional DNA primase/polymerase, N-terminal